MERVAFLLDDTGEHIGALLNPETVVMSRTAGVEPRRSAGGRLTGAGLADDPLLFTGGGHTELRLDLLFDVDLAPAQLGVLDVRQMTRPIWRLAENSAEVDRKRRPPSVHFLWGRAWDMPGIVTEVAERFDRFDADGSPLRSWMRLVFVRIGQSADEEGGENYELAQRLPPVDLTAPPVDTVPVPGDGSMDLLPPVPGEPVLPARPNTPTREYGIASMNAYGTPLLVKQILAFTGIDDPFHFAGRLAIPPLGETAR
jgi:hypothetical protein